MVDKLSDEWGGLIVGVIRDGIIYKLQNGLDLTLTQELIYNQFKNKFDELV